MSGWNTRSIRVKNVSDSGRYRKGDVVWAPDPFKQGSNPRLWLVLTADSLPYVGQEYICAALTTSDLPDNFRIGSDWITGRNPQIESYCSPWVVATIKHRAIANPQGKITTSFTDRVIGDCKRYLDS
ncbi:hypothetical protein OB955_00330 [Halobacteria archaeon AArc-m2/3/4]|uniref:PemK-like, MazF-like toxin of type II toxin-antitoxin system n=1 Tax=Natronoglomus mannanivorans TaxID=2979990 RepID=A0AAP2YZ81_9EURY|nr:hypothetical protein [Halobacteria archaeon AArc-xg1-1]MCU4971184.1 hypothetical protein [Halobacteria archaeon AArc-m2/3/4]